MSLDWQRLWRAVAAAYFTILVSGGVLIQGNVSALIALLGTLAFVAVMLYRVWPALEENWERRQVEGQHPLQPSLARVLGTLLITAGMTLVFYATFHVLTDQLLGQGRPYDDWARVRSFMIFVMPAYMMWLAIELKLRG